MNATATQTATACSCRYPDDCCPACYEKKKEELKEKLWQAMAELARLQEELAKLEREKKLHLRG